MNKNLFNNIYYGLSWNLNTDSLLRIIGLGKLGLLGTT